LNNNGSPTTKRPPIASRNDEKHALNTDELEKNYAIKGNNNPADSGARFTKYLRVSDLVEHQLGIQKFYKGLHSHEGVIQLCINTIDHMNMPQVAQVFLQQQIYECFLQLEI